MRELDAIDRRWIEHTYFLTRQASQPLRVLAEPVIGPTPAAANGTVLPTDDGLVMWYTAPYRRRARAGPLFEQCVHYATSRDGHTFEKPALGLREYGGRDEGNIVLAPNDTDDQGQALNGIGGCSGFCVLDAEQRPVPHARGRFTALFNASIPGRGNGLCLAHSDDGLRWNAYPENPVRLGSSDTYNNFFFDERMGRYVAYIRPSVHAGPARVNRLMARIESDDLVHWGGDRVVVDTDDRDAPPQGRIKLKKDELGYPRGRDVQFYGMTVTPLRGLYLGLALLYDSTSGLMWSELLHSYDGTEWRREATREPFVPLGPDGSWDCGMIGFVSAGCPAEIGEHWYVYYTGMNWDHHSRIRGMKDKGRMRLIGAARTKRARLVGYHTGPVATARAERRSGREVPPEWRDKGELLTRPLMLDCSELFANTDAEDGSLEVEVCDVGGKPIPGFSRQDAVPIQEDCLRAAVRFRGDASMAQLRGREVRLRLHLTRASLYGLGLG